MESVPVFQDQRPSSINTAVKMDKDASPNAKEILRRISPQRQQLLEQRVTRKVFSAIPSADKNVHAQDSPVASKAGAGQAAHSTPQPERRVRKRRTPVKSTLALQKKRESSSLQPSSTKSRAHRKPTPSPPRPNVTKRDADSMSQLSQRTTSTELNGSRSNSRTSPFEIDTGSNSHSRSFFRPSSRSQSRDGHRVVSSPMKKGNSQPTPIDMSKMVIDEAGWIKHGPEDGHGDLSGRNSRGASSAIATTPEKGFRDNEASNGSTSGRSSPRNSRKRGQSGGNNASAAGLSLEKKIAKKRNRLDGRTSANSSRDGFPLSVEDVPSNQPSITSFFMGSNTAAGAAPPSGSSAIPVGATPPGLITTKRGVAPTACSNAAPSTPTAISNRVGDKFARQQVEMLQAKLVNEVEKNSSLASENERLRQLVKSLETDLQDARSGVEQLQQTQQNRVTRMRTFFESILREKIALERSKALQDIAQQNVAVGRVIYVRSGARVQDMWCDGEEFLTLNREKARVKRDREELELQKKDIAKQFRKAKADSKTASKASASSAHLVELEGSMRPPTAAGAAVTQTPEWGRLVEREESIRMALNDVKRREQSLTAQEEALRTRKKMHWLNIKRVSDFAESRFSQWSKPLNNRYVLVDLLGKGGFSEVWKAVDLVNFRFVACKIHQLSQGWSEAKMANYTKHATREYAIHKALRHERVVRYNALLAGASWHLFFVWLAPVPQLVLGFVMQLTGFLLRRFLCTTSSKLTKCRSPPCSSTVRGTSPQHARFIALHIKLTLYMCFCVVVVHVQSGSFDVLEREQRASRERSARHHHSSVVSPEVLGRSKENYSL